LVLKGLIKQSHEEVRGLGDVAARILDLTRDRLLLLVGSAVGRIGSSCNYRMRSVSMISGNTVTIFLHGEVH
jgi:hypothetical protein